MHRFALSLVSPAGARGRLTILTFHRVLPQPDPLLPDLPDVVEFEAQMRWVREWFNVVPLARAIEQLRAGGICSRALAITFDDGYADNEELAAPILQRLGLPATVFVAPGFLDGGCMFNDRIIEAVRRFDGDVLDLQDLDLGRHDVASPGARRQALNQLLRDIMHLGDGRRDAVSEAVVRRARATVPTQLMMRTAQVARLPSYGIDVGAHTVNHPILARVAADTAWDEIARSKSRLEQIVQRPVDLFAYPNGVPGRDYTREHVGMVERAGFAAAVSTSPGAASARSDRFQLPRFAPWSGSRFKYGARLVNNLASREREPLAA
jgi:peptidoglycan/xylan/chitin deacetylase (PgdA/CDA1 family)